MGKAADNQSQIPSQEQRAEQRRSQVLKEIALALVTSEDASNESRQRGGFDPYDSRLGRANRDVWGQKRRA